MPICDWIEDRFFIVETRRPMVLQSHQKDILNLFTERTESGRFKYQNLFYSTIKKSAKTSIGAAYMRWAAECWGPYQEIYHVGNKFEQAKKRAFQIMQYSIELAPSAVQAEWEIQKTMMQYRNGSRVAPLPINAAGEAGGNQSLTVWTELWGYRYEEDERMWNEMQPVATRKLGQRFSESYAGYEGESILLKRIWDLAMEGEQISDDPPLYVNENASLCAYIDQGTAARRMPWQTGEEGERYYRQQAVTELPHEFERLHLNQWVSSQNALIAMPHWDRLNYNDPENGIERPEKFDFVTLGADGSVSGDCSALVVVGFAGGKAWEIETFVWEPPRGGKLDYDMTITPGIEACIEKWNPKTVAYDPYQLHDVMTRLSKKYRRVDFYSFPQGQERLEGDTKLMKHIIQEELHHSGNEIMREHVQNADGKLSGSDKAIRIVKRDAARKIDSMIALSMAIKKGFELLEAPTKSRAYKVRVIER